MNAEFEIFYRAYLEAALWSSIDDDDEPLDSNYGIDDLSTETIGKTKIDCQAFFNHNYELIKSNLDRAGHDFWLTRNHHGSGFWDGDWPEDVGDELTEASHSYGECSLYVSNGKVYCD